MLKGGNTMKKLNVFKKMLALAASAALLALLPGANTLTVSAEEPATYYLMYEERDSSDGVWYYQTGSEWDANAEHRELYYLQETLKNGDLVIVGNAAPSLLTLDVHLSNLTISNTSGGLAMVSVTGGIDNCFFLNGTTGSISGNVFNAYVNGASTANFNNNVTNLYSYNDNPDAGANIGVSGTVAYFASTDSHESNTPYGINFAANTFRVENGDLKTDSSQYTRDISGGPVAPGAQSRPQTSSRPAASGSGASNEYDAVPKTGESYPAVWLSLAAVSCLGISLVLRRTSKQ